MPEIVPSKSAKFGGPKSPNPCTDTTVAHEYAGGGNCMDEKNCSQSLRVLEVVQLSTVSGATDTIGAVVDVTSAPRTPCSAPTTSGAQNNAATANVEPTRRITASPSS